jgi:diguanylate cyclase (GGDEF)-like protein
MDDLVDATDADHVVVVRRRQDGTALDATLVTRSAGVPLTTTVLPTADLDGPIAWGPVGTVVAVGPGIRSTDEAPPLDRRAHDRSNGGPTAEAEPHPEPADGDVDRPVLVRRAPPPGRAAIPGPYVEAARPITRAPVAAAGPILATRPPIGEPARARASRYARAALSETAALLRDLGLPTPSLRTGRGAAPVAEVLGRGLDAAVADRVSQRVRSVFGLAQTLAIAMRTDQGLLGAIVLSRRDRISWSDASRRVLRAAAVEVASALTRADSHREAEAAAATDPLTGLPNRRYFDEFCGLLARRRRAGDAVAVLMIDIDKFKLLNDTYGHPVGDEVLKAVAGAIVSTIREEDVPARVGGEEFAVLLRNPSPEVAIEVGERVREAVSSLDLSDVGVPAVSVSVGVASALGPEEPMPDVVGRADQALLRAKRAGRDRVIAA